MSGPKLNFVASYPKSGNTWVRMLVGTYLYNAEGKFTRTRTSDTNTSPYHNVSPVPVEQLTLDKQLQLRPAAMFQLTRPPRALLVKSHDAALVYNGQSQFASQYTDRVVCVVRDPKDIAPSLADHIGVSIEEAVEKMDETGFKLGGKNNLSHVIHSWSDNVTSWLNYDEAPTHWVRYEDLHADTAGELEGILSFLGFEDIDRAAVRDAVEKNRFDRVQKLEEEEGFVEQSESQDRFFRKGKTGSWREDVPVPLARKIERDHGEVMRELGYELEVASDPVPREDLPRSASVEETDERSEDATEPESPHEEAAAPVNEVGMKVG